MYFLRVGELQFAYEGNQCDKEMYWALFKDEKRYKEVMLFKDNK